MRRDGENTRLSGQVDLRLSQESAPRSPPYDARMRRVTLIAATAVLILLGPASFANNVSIGPQAMEGNLIISPGTIVKAGLSFTIPGSHPATTVQFADPAVSFDNVVCTSGSGGGSFTVALGSGGLLGPYSDPSNDTAWLPTGDQASAASYQGSIAAPDLCHGGTMSLRNGGTFRADLQSDQHNAINVRFHYSANGTSGSWSATKSFDPDPISGSSVPEGSNGIIVLSALIAIVALVAARRQRRARRNVTAGVD